MLVDVPVDVTVVVAPSSVVDVRVVAEEQGSNARFSSSQHRAGLVSETLLLVELLPLVEALLAVGSLLAVRPLSAVEPLSTVEKLLAVGLLLTMAEIFAAGGSEEVEHEELFSSVSTDLEACSPAEYVLLLSLLLSTFRDAVDDGMTVTVTVEVEVKRTVCIADAGNSCLG